MAAAQLESDNSKDKTSRKHNRGVKNETTFIDSEKREGIHEGTYITSYEGAS